MTGTSRLGVVVNPTAGQGRGRVAGARTVELLRAHGHEVLDLSGPNLPLALESAHDTVHGEGPADAVPGPAGLDALVVVGGDGMVHLGVNAVAGTPTPLGIVAVGSGNDFAHAAGLPVRDVRAAVEAIEAALVAGPRTVDAATVRTPPGRHPGAVDRAAGPAGTAVTAGTASSDSTGGSAGRAEPSEPLPVPPTWFCGALSAGLDAAVNARANALRRPRGAARYAYAALAELTRFTPYGYRITLDRIDGVDGAAGAGGAERGEDGAGSAHRADGAGSEVWASPGTLVAVANSPRIGGGIRIAPDARIDDGLLDVVLAGPLTRSGAARLFPGTYSGRHVRHPAVQVRRAREVLLEATTAGGTPPPAFADGEHIGPLPLQVRVHPGALRLLGPPARTAGRDDVPAGRRPQERTEAPDEP